MNSNQNDAPPQALFLADCHFHVERDAAEEARYRDVLDLLHRHAGIGDLVLLGDIFDFWFDYPHFYMKGYEALLRVLDAVRAAGTRLHFVGGNHDIWAARYLHRRYGTDPDAGPVTLRLDGQRVHCVHGDGLLGRDLFYAAFRAVVRHPLGVGLGKSLHPELLFALSSWLSKSSRQSTRDEAAGIERKADAWLRRQHRADWDHLVMGHVHHAYGTHAGGRRLTCLGGWLGDRNYALWRDGALHPARWPTASTASPAPDALA